VRLTVTGSRAMGPVASRVFGSVSRALVSRGDVPVAVVRAGATATVPGGPIVCGLTGDPGGTGARACAASRIATRLEVSLALVHAVWPASARPGMAQPCQSSMASDRQSGDELLRRVAEALREACEVKRVARVGGRAEVLVATAEEFDADLIVLGHRGRGGATHGGDREHALEVIARDRRPVMLLSPDVASGFLG
jgi:nucleotide-binding universal stress UspA family protein